MGKHRYKFDGRIKTLKEWSADPRCKVPYTTLYRRIKVHGWPLKRALLTPSQYGVSPVGDWQYPPPPPKNGWPIHFLQALVMLYQDEGLTVERACRRTALTQREFVHLCHAYDPELYRRFAARITKEEDRAQGSRPYSKEAGDPIILQRDRRLIRKGVRSFEDYHQNTVTIYESKIEKLEESSDSWSSFSNR